MIEFKGEILQEYKLYLIKKERFSELMFVSIVAVIISMAIIIVAIFWDLIALCCLALPVVLIIVDILPKQGYEKIIPTRITIDENLITIEAMANIPSKDIADVTHVIDGGDFYQICFKFPYRANYFFCQKDLIIQGTLEEFEALFEGKIVRKKLKR